MKILLEVEDRIRADSTCVYYYHAFKQLADVVKVYPEELPYIKPNLFDLHVRVDYGIHNYWPKELKPSVYVVIDTHIESADRIKMAKEGDFDFIFTAQQAGAKLRWHTNQVQFLPLGCDPNFHKVCGKRDKLYDICFVGSTHPGWQKRRIERLDTIFKAFPRFYFGNVYFRDMAEKFAESKLVFNSQLSDDINMRVFEAMCSGSALYTQVLNWEGMFLDDVHLISYKDEGEMVDKAKHFLLHEGQREKIALAGQKEVIEKHTYTKRAEKILEVVNATR